MKHTADSIHAPLIVVWIPVYFYPEINDLLGAKTDQIVLCTINLGNDATGRRANDTHHALHQRALAVAIGTEQSNRFSRVDHDRHVFDDADGAVSGVYALDGQSTGQDMPSRPRGS